MKKYLIIILSLIVILSAAAFVGCDNQDNGGEAEEKFTVSFDAVEPDYGSVSLQRLENVAKNADIVVNGNKLTIDGNEIVATPAEQTEEFIYLFDRWSAPEKVYGNLTITAYFTRSQKAVAAKYTVTVENGTGGGEYEEGASVTVIATIPDGKKFAGWFSDGQRVSGENPYTFSAEKDITLSAAFEEIGKHDDALEVSLDNQWFNLEEELENFATSEMTLVFEYKAVESQHNAGNGFKFSLWAKDWAESSRRTDLIAVDVVENTIDVGSIIRLEDGWYQVTIPASKLPVNTLEGATGNETIGSFIFNEVDHVVLIDEVRFIPSDKRDDAIGISLDNQWFNLDEELENFASSGMTLVFEYKAVESQQNTGNGFRFTLWAKDWAERSRRTDIISVNVVDNTIDVGNIIRLDDDWYRVTIPASKLPLNVLEGATGAETIGSFIFNEVDHAVLIDEVGFVPSDKRDDAIGISLDNQWFNLDEELENFVSSGKALVFEYKAVESQQNTGNGFRFTLWAKDWAESSRRTELVAVNVVENKIDVGSIEQLEDGWYRVIIPASKLPVNTPEGATGAETIGSFIFNEVDHAVLIDEVGFIDAPAAIKFTVTVEGGTGSGEYEQGEEVTVTADEDEGRTFVEWQINGESVSTEKTYTFTAEEDVHIVAVFGEAN